MIRAAARSMGGTIRPRDIIAALKLKDVIVSSPQVSKTLKAAGFHRKRSGKKELPPPDRTARPAATETTRATR